MSAKNAWFIIIWVSLFAIGMAFVESAVVVYLRELYYPTGFEFPLREIHSNIALTEAIREAATLLMLISIGILVGRTATEKFGVFLFAFALWDIFYYVFLKAILNWPVEWLEWDVLFMLPVTWVGPVLAPMLNALVMAILGTLIIWAVQKHGRASISRLQWGLLIIGAVFILISYMEDYVLFMNDKMPLMEMFALSEEQISKYITQYKPDNFNWFLYGAGFILHVIAVILFGRKSIGR
ncbi:MAG: hypothetical protein K9I94_01135 [Bacteroidales bacterium]|nr:hypothetical protein [Bacteroidales bacterium]